MSRFATPADRIQLASDSYGWHLPRDVQKSWKTFKQTTRAVAEKLSCYLMLRSPELHDLSHQPEKPGSYGYFTVHSTEQEARQAITNVSVHPEWFNSLEASIFVDFCPERSCVGSIVDVSSCNWLNLVPYMMKANVLIWLCWGSPPFATSNPEWSTQSWTSMFAPTVYKSGQSTLLGTGKNPPFVSSNPHSSRNFWSNNSSSNNPWSNSSSSNNPWSNSSSSNTPWLTQSSSAQSWSWASTSAPTHHKSGQSGSLESVKSPASTSPPVEQGSGQCPGETMRAYFERKKQQHLQWKREESDKARQAHLNREAAQKKKACPGKKGPLVYHWVRVGKFFRVRTLLLRALAEHYWNWSFDPQEGEHAEPEENDEYDSNDSDFGEIYRASSGGFDFLVNFLACSTVSTDVGFGSAFLVNFLACSTVGIDVQFGCTFLVNFFT
ncbi:hypothetical protein BDZ97DRAFT_1760686 [Flammula alnicola]|nr:hypothetical protein BDZ97DRAFT_1760686 [Flammula alnicola]